MELVESRKFYYHTGDEIKLNDRVSRSLRSGDRAFGEVIKIIINAGIVIAWKTHEGMISETIYTKLEIENSTFDLEGRSTQPIESPVASIPNANKVTRVAITEPTDEQKARYYNFASVEDYRDHVESHQARFIRS